MTTLLAILLAAAAIANTPTAPPSFSPGPNRPATVVTTDELTGLRWRCARPYQDETCFAGWRVGVGLVTGP